MALQPLSDYRECHTTVQEGVELADKINETVAKRVKFDWVLKPVHDSIRAKSRFSKSSQLPAREYSLGESPRDN